MFFEKLQPSALVLCLDRSRDQEHAENEGEAWHSLVAYPSRQAVQTFGLLKSKSLRPEPSIDLLQRPEESAHPTICMYVRRQPIHVRSIRQHVLEHREVAPHIQHRQEQQNDREDKRAAVHGVICAGSLCPTYRPQTKPVRWLTGCKEPVAVGSLHIFHASYAVAQARPAVNMIHTRSRSENCIAPFYTQTSQ